MRRLISVCDARLAQLEQIFLTIIILFMLGLGFLQIILRKVFDFSILWGDPLLRHLVLWVSFIGASLATREDSHIKIDLIKRLLSAFLYKLALRIIQLFSAAISFLLSYASYNFVRMEYEFGTTIFGEMSAWYFQIIVPIGFFIMGLRFLIRILFVIPEEN